MKYRKKPVVIDAFQWDGTFGSFNEIYEFAFNISTRPMSLGSRGFIINTLEGEMTVDKNDWVIFGVKGEPYPCKPDIFEMTYEAVA